MRAPSWLPVPLRRALRTVRRYWRVGRRRAARAAEPARRAWRRSLQLRVVTTTTVLTIVVIAVLGNILLTRVRDGLLDDKVQAALIEAASGSATAQESFDSADRASNGQEKELAPVARARAIPMIATANRGRRA